MTDSLHREGSFVKISLEVAFAVVTSVGFALTLIWPDWIEGIFGADLDHGNGSLEWAIVASCFLVLSTIFTLMAVIEMRTVRRSVLAMGFLAGPPNPNNQISGRSQA